MKALALAGKCERFQVEGAHFKLKRVTAAQAPIAGSVHSRNYLNLNMLSVS